MMGRYPNCCNVWFLFWLSAGGYDEMIMIAVMIYDEEDFCCLILLFNRGQVEHNHTKRVLVIICNDITA